MKSEPRKPPLVRFSRLIAVGISLVATGAAANAGLIFGFLWKQQYLAVGLFGLAIYVAITASVFGKERERIVALGVASASFASVGLLMVIGYPGFFGALFLIPAGLLLLLSWANKRYYDQLD